MSNESLSQKLDDMRNNLKNCDRLELPSNRKSDLPSLSVFKEHVAQIDKLTSAMYTALISAFHAELEAIPSKPQDAYASLLIAVLLLIAIDQKEEAGENTTEEMINNLQEKSSLYKQPLSNYLKRTQPEQNSTIHRIITQLA